MPLIPAALAMAAALLLLTIPVLHWRRDVDRLRVLNDLGKYARPLRRATGSAAQDRPSLMDLAARVLVRGPLRDRLARQLTYAARPEADAVDAEARRKVMYAAAGITLGLLVGLGGGSFGVGLFYGLALGAFGFVVPDILLYNVAIKRDEAIARELADGLDLLTLCVESGMSFQGALGQVVANQKGAVAEEFARVLSEMALGQSRAQALTSMLSRTRQPDLMRFIGALLQVDRMGVPVGPVLSEQATDMRARRRERAREKAQQLPVKILLPVMLCFLPGVFIVVIGPAAVNVFRSLGGL